MNISEVSICLTCVRWGEVEFAKLKQGIDKDQDLPELPTEGTVKPDPQIPVLKPPLLEKLPLETKNSSHGIPVLMKPEEISANISTEDLLRDSKTKPGIHENKDQQAGVNYFTPPPLYKHRGVYLLEINPPHF